MVKAYIRAVQKYRAIHPNSKAVNTYPDAYTHFVRDVFYPDIPKQWEELNNGLFDKPDYKQFLMDYFKIKL